MVKKIRLMQITHDLAIGGLQQVVVNICKTIDRKKFDIAVLCLRSMGEYLPEIEKQRIKVTLIDQKQTGVDYFSFLKVAQILKQEKIDVIHTHNTQPFIDGTMGALLSGVKRIVHTDHAREFPDKKRYMFAEYVMSFFAKAVVGVSQHTSENLIKYENISPNKIVTIPNGIDEKTYNIAIDKKKKKKALGITQKGPVIGLGVRLAAQKGLVYLLDALPEIIKQFPELALVIAGKGELEADLKNKAHKLGITKNVYFIGPRLDMHEILKLLDLYVLPSLWEGLPMVLLEAMAAGCPIIATDVGGNSMAVSHGYNGSLIEPQNSKMLATEVIKVLSDNTIKEMYVENGYKVFNQKFRAKVMTQSYEKLYCG